MAETNEDLLARLNELGIERPLPGDAGGGPGGDARLESLLGRISELTGDPAVLKAGGLPVTQDLPRREPPPVTAKPPTKVTMGEAPGLPAAAQQAAAGLPYLPAEPESFQEAGVTEGQVEALLLKLLLALGTASGREATDHVKLPFNLIGALLTRMKSDQLVVYVSDAPMNDYVYALTEFGRERARRYLAECTYFGAAPVSLDQYLGSVSAQSLTTQSTTVEDLRRAFSDLLINANMLRRLGPAVNSGRGLFLFGPPGNGKTSIAERVTAAFGSLVWIPRCLGIDGQIIRFFDPSNHEEVPLEASEGLLEDRKIDKRWVRIRRPTIVAGGELTMENLEVTLNTSTGVCESPLQLKSNCGTLVIDDFGRQKMSIDTLLNRWIVPLEKRFDFLNLPNGRKIQVPFDQLIIFATNLEPRDLVDDAFLRRIPYKVEVTDPSEDEFRQLIKIMAAQLGIHYDEAAVDYLIATHYRDAQRPFRCCQPRDLLMQVRNYCIFTKTELAMSNEMFDFAVENYFSVM